MRDLYVATTSSLLLVLSIFTFGALLDDFDIQVTLQLVNAYLRQTLPETFVLANIILIERICTF